MRDKISPTGDRPPRIGIFFSLQKSGITEVFVHRDNVTFLEVDDFGVIDRLGYSSQYLVLGEYLNFEKVIF